MARRRIPEEKRQIEQVQVFDIAEDGKGVGRSEDLVVFIEKAVPGDLVDVTLYRKKRILPKPGSTV